MILIFNQLIVKTFLKLFQYVFLTIAFLLSFNQAFGQTGTTKNVLFIGNSYTSANNLPQMIADAASSAGDNLTFDSSAPGGAFLVDQLNNPAYTGISKIMNGGWDHVVLQDQSLTYTSYIAFYVNAAYRLDTISENYNNCAQTMFYITWGRQNGGSFGSYHAMDSAIESNYKTAADSLNFETTPVGAIWRDLRINNPSIQLFTADGSHPTVAGSYAACCCCGFYSTLFRKDPTQITFNSSLNPADAEIIRNTAKLIVFDSLPKWNVGVYDSLMSSDCLSAEINELTEANRLTIFPNPASDFLTIEYSNQADIGELQFEIYNAIGQLIQEVTLSTGGKLNTNNLRPGIYHLKCKNRRVEILRFVKL